jgi:hypothetical protein
MHFLCPEGRCSVTVSCPNATSCYYMTISRTTSIYRSNLPCGIGHTLNNWSIYCDILRVLESLCLITREYIWGRGNQWQILSSGLCSSTKPNWTNEKKKQQINMYAGWRYNSTITDHGTRLKRMDTSTPPLHPLGNSPRFSSNRKFGGGARNRSGSCGIEKNPLSLPGIEPYSFSL